MTDGRVFERLDPCSLCGEPITVTVDVDTDPERPGGRVFLSRGAQLHVWACEARVAAEAERIAMEAAEPIAADELGYLPEYSI